MVTWPSLRESGALRSRFLTEADYQIWCRKFQKAYTDPKRPWDAAWGYACRKEGSLAIFSHRSLISNTGIAHEKSTHRGNKDFRSIWMREITDINFPLQHPPCVLPDIKKEREIRRSVAAPQRFFPRLRARIKASPALFSDMRSIVKNYYDFI
jgi:hypothetical protein